MATVEERVEELAGQVQNLSAEMAHRGEVIAEQGAEISRLRQIIAGLAAIGATAAAGHAVNRLDEPMPASPPAHVASVEL